jgi:hypothetical protein
MHQIRHTLPVAVIGSEDLYTAIRAALIAQGTSLTAWCKVRHINRQTAEKALRGQRHSKRAEALRARLVAEVLALEEAA